MNTNRLSLSSSVFAGRVRKFDTYQPNPRTSQRVTKKTPQAKNKTKTRHIEKTNSTNTIIPRSVSTTPIKLSVPVASASPISKTQSLALQAVGNTRSFHHSQFDNMIPAAINSVKSKLHTAMYIMATAVFIFASTVSVQTLLTNKETKAQVEEVLGESANTTQDEQGVAEGTGSLPAEKEVTTNAISSYTVTNPEAPKYLRIPELGVFSRIKSLGIDEGAVGAPRNINDVGWFNGSAKPGDSVGASLLLGHVSGWTSPGVFKHLGNLKPGARFEVEKGSGEKIQYEVVRSEDIALSEINMGNILGTENAGEHDLKLMTCSGKYNRETETYEERKVVYAKVLR